MRIDNTNMISTILSSTISPFESYLKKNDITMLSSRDRKEKVAANAFNSIVRSLKHKVDNVIFDGKNLEKYKCYFDK